MSDVAVTALAEALAQVSRNLERHIERRARELAAKKVAPMEKAVQRAQQLQEQQQASFDQRLGDLQQEFERQRQALLRNAERIEGERDEARERVRELEGSAVIATADVVLLGTQRPAESIRGEQLHVLMIRRKHAPFQGHRALPGGHVDQGETFEQAAHRELAEETGITVKSLRFIGLYDTPDRDPRGRYVSAVYTAYVPRLVEPTAGSDALGVGWVSVDELLTRGKVAFDHERIIRDVLKLEQQ